ncbi:MAG: UV DNA damage repair endonuclease UvsE [Methanoregula sp.]|nr:UV DNA damage repair endonuclease UvsE [Methanoregula sp.]
MRIGYPCINRSIGCTASRTFRLLSYSEDRLRDTVQENLSCLAKILEYNKTHNLLFFRITSDLVPFASHPVCTFPWQNYFSGEFGQIGEYIRRNGFRISMHPDQFVLLNAPDEGVLRRSIADLIYQVQVLDLMGLGNSAKVQVHVGGVYGNKPASMDRFVKQYTMLDPAIRNRLVIENDERLYTLSDCLAIHEQTGIPVIMDSFHHALLNNGEQLTDLLKSVRQTWKGSDGIPMADYSSQEPEKRAGAHAEHIVAGDFRQFLEITRPADFDIMLEIKDKERSALEALRIAKGDPRLVIGHPEEP